MEIAELPALPPSDNIISVFCPNDELHKEILKNLYTQLEAIQSIKFPSEVKEEKYISLGNWCHYMDEGFKSIIRVFKKETGTFSLYKHPDNDNIYIMRRAPYINLTNGDEDQIKGARRCIIVSDRFEIVSSY